MAGEYPKRAAALAIAGVIWFGIGSSAVAAARDVRATVAEESAQYRARHFPNRGMPPKHDWRGERAVARASETGELETPGGVGYGFYFYNSALLWTNSTTADYYIIAPTYSGGNVSFLYLTSTCRSQLGTESLVAFSGMNEAGFWIYDWAQPAANRWQVMIDLPAAHPEYLMTRPDEFGIPRQMVHVRNGTYYTGYAAGQYQWRNRVQLFNSVSGGWDLIYSYDYGTTNLTDNLYSASGSSIGFWGPIVETFDTYTNVVPVGFDQVRLFQDGNPNSFWLSANNCYVLQSSPWQLLTMVSNTSFSVGVGQTVPTGPFNVGTLCVTVNTNTASFTLNPAGGITSPSWVVRESGNRWDKTVVGLAPGTYSISFGAVAGLTTPVQQSFAISSNNITSVQALYGTNVADTPIAVTGYNRDVVVENTAGGGNTTPYTQAFNTTAANTFYEAGLGDTGSWSYGDGAGGLPQSGLFTSALDGATAFQFASYTANNVLYLTPGSPSGTLTLAAPAAFKSLSVLAASANGGGTGSFVIHFANGTSSRALSFNAADWWSYSAGSALTGFGMIFTGNYGVFYMQDAPDLPNLYQTSVRLDTPGLNGKPIASLTFTMPSGSGTSTGVFAVSGTVAPPAFQRVKRVGSTVTLSWDAVSNHWYQVQYKTNLAQSSWGNLGAVVMATNYMATTSDPGASGPRRFYRVIQVQ